MATATTNGASTVIKPDHEAGRKHFIFSDEHEDLRESLSPGSRRSSTPTATSGRRPTGPARR